MTTNIFFLNIYPMLPEVFLLFVICYCLIFGSIMSNSFFFNFPILNNVKFFVLLSLFFCLVLLINIHPIFIISWNNLFICDFFIFYSKILISIFTILWFFMFLMNTNILNFEFWIFILLSLLSIFLLLQSYDFLSIYINLEFFSLIFYILASFKRNSEFSTESGLKYFILGAFSSSLLLFGFSLVYNFTGLTNLQDLFILFNGDLKLSINFSMYLSLLLAALCIFTSFFLKLGVAPFHYWLPDVYEGAPVSVTAFFAIFPKLPILTLITKFIFIIFLDFSYNEIYCYLIFCTFITSLVGTFGAFIQIKWKRFLAFSSISHLGFFLINFCTLNPLNLVNLIIYLIIYLIMTCGFFSFFNSLNLFKFPKFSSVRFLHSLNFLGLLNPTLAFSFVILIFSLAGIPPLLGFFSKFFVLFSAISQNFFGIILLLLILNCVSCFYYIKLIKQIYFENYNKSLLPIFINFSQTNIIVLGFSIFLILLSFINIDFFFLLGNLMCLNFLN